MAAGRRRADLAGEGHERAQGGAVEVEGKVALLWARGIEAGWRGSAGGHAGDKLCSGSARREREEEEGDGENG